MNKSERTLVVSVPEPRSLDIIFTQEQKKHLFENYEVVETTSIDFGTLPEETLARVKYVIGQPPISLDLFERMRSLKCVLNVESNLINNMPYDHLFARGVHVVTTGAVFAEPVAEMGLGLALDLARGIGHANALFEVGMERWGGDGNKAARLLSGADVGIIGFGDLGRALNRLLVGFRAKVKSFDPWLPASILRENGVVPATLNEVLEQSDFVFVVAAVTSENAGFLNGESFARMRKGAAFILLSRADVVDFAALISAVESGHIVAASDVFPEEPLPKDHPVRRVQNFIKSAHRAGALDVAFKRMGDMVLEDMALMERGLPPLRCKRAERETVARMRSKPVTTN